MKTQFFTHLSLLAFVALTLSSCLEDNVEVTRKFFSDEDYQVINQYLELENEPVSFSQDFPRHLGFFNNSVNNSQALLGRVLFYDNQLSKNEAVNCASCHLQEAAFSDVVALSEGFDGELTERNSLSLGVNLKTYDNTGSALFWDERAFTVEEQSLETLQNQIEMGMDIPSLVNRLKSTEYYPILFEKAFGSDEISGDRITQALAQFVNSIASFESKFDKELETRHGDTFGTFDSFTDEENMGKQLFVEHCQNCHGNNQFAFERVANNGLDMEYEDNGLGKLHNDVSLNGVFKVPLLRNIALTGPYMHDGRFETLEEVIDHYNDGIENHPNLDFRLKNEFQTAPKRLGLNDDEKAALVAFLNTLTDEALTADVRYSDPFK